MYFLNAISSNALIQYLTTDDFEERLILKLFRAIEKLAELRNRSVHSSAGVSLLLIVNEYGDDIAIDDFSSTIMSDIENVYYTD